MQRQIALAYAVAGLAAAIAIVTAFGSTTGLLTPRTHAVADTPSGDGLGAQSCEPAPSANPEPVADGPTQPTEVELRPAPRAVLHASMPAAVAEASLDGVRLASASDLAGEGDVEIVYVDEPAPRRGHGDDDDEDSDDEDSDERDSDDKEGDERRKKDAERDGGGKRRDREERDDD